jgi:hypothetical protein
MSKLFEKTQIGRAPETDRDPRISVFIEPSGGGGQLAVAGVFNFVSNSMGAAADVQLDRTFDDDILVTGFGQKITALKIAGISMGDLGDAVCDNAKEEAAAGGSGSVDETTLPGLYLKYHAGNRLKQGEKVPLVSVVYGGTVFEGFLTGLTQSPYTISDAGAFDVIQYTLTITGSLKRKSG